MNKKQSNKFVYSIAFCNFFDSAFPVSTGLALPFWTVAFGIDALGNGIFGALREFGSAIGALIGGPISDRFGRKTAYLIGLFVSLLGSIFCTVGWDFFSLAIGFSCMGLGIGVCVPVGWTYISELSDAESRSSNVGISQAARPVAIVLMYVLFFIFSIVLPATDASGNILPSGTYWIFDGLFGSRLFFVFLTIIGIFSILTQKNVPESKDWKQKNEKVFNIETARKIINNKRTLLAVIFLTCVYVPWNIVATTVSQFMPTMAKTAGLEGVNFAIISIAVCVVSLVAVSIFPKCVKKYSYKSLFSFGCITGILGMLAVFLFEVQYVYWGDSCRWIVLFFPLFWGGQIGFSAQTFFSIWSSELFPTKVRSMIQGFCFFLVRGISGLWSLFIFGILDATTNEGAAWTILFLIAFLILTFAAGLIGCPKTQNKSLDKITEERYGNLYD